MGATLREILADGGTRTVQRKGMITLDKEWRDEHGVEEGDQIAYRKTEDGTLEIIPPGE